jgi:hypothetical protein
MAGRLEVGRGKPLLGDESAGGKKEKEEDYKSQDAIVIP